MSQSADPREWRPPPAAVAPDGEPSASDERRQRPPDRHRRSRPLLSGTVDAETRLIALGWVALAPFGSKRSVGQWIDRQVERAGGWDRERTSRDDRMRRNVRAQVRIILDSIARLHLGCEPRERAAALAAIRAAAGEVDRLLPPRLPPGAPEPEYFI